MKKIFVSLLACLIFTTSVMGSTGELTIDFTKDLTISPKILRAKEHIIMVREQSSGSI